MGDNGDKVKFKYFINIGLNEDGTFGVTTNVPNLVTGFGMLKLGETGIINHIARTQGNKIIKPKVGL